MLLLYPGRSPVLDATAEAATAREYGAWLGRLSAAGRAVSGDRLADGAAVVPPGAPATGSDLQGFFVITADSVEDARRIAAESPHADRGGVVVVRAIDTPR
jgi:hypothetical protein